MPPSEELAYEDARAAWDWLAREYPTRPRYLFGHSLGGAIAIELASAVTDEAGTIVNIADMKPQTTDGHPSTKPAKYALEMNQGWFAKRGIKAGAKINGLRNAPPGQ